MHFFRRTVPWIRASVAAVLASACGTAAASECLALRTHTAPAPGSTLEATTSIAVTYVLHPYAGVRGGDVRLVEDPFDLADGTSFELLDGSRRIALSIARREKTLSGSNVAGIIVLRPAKTLQPGHSYSLRMNRLANGVRCAGLNGPCADEEREASRTAMAWAVRPSQPKRRPPSCMGPHLGLRLEQAADASGPRNALRVVLPEPCTGAIAYRAELILIDGRSVVTEFIPAGSGALTLHVGDCSGAGKIAPRDVYEVRVAPVSDAGARAEQPIVFRPEVRPQDVGVQPVQPR